MKRKIAAVLMADVGGMSRSLAADEAAAAGRLEAWRNVIREVVRHGGGRMLDSGGAALLAEFPSAVGVMRAAVDMQETLRVRNKALALAERVDFKVGIAIAEVPDGEGEVPAETLAAVTRLLELAAPGGVCISRSVREAVAGKLKIAFQEVAPDGTALDRAAPATYRVMADRTKPAREAWRPPRLPGWATSPAAVGGATAVLAAALVFFIMPRPGPPAAPPAADAPAAAEAAPAAAEPDAKAPRPGGTLVFKPAHAPDPSAVLSAKRMLPNAWRDCEAGTPPDTAAKACQLLIDSGLSKDNELAEIHIRHGRALRDRGDLDKALESLDAALAIAQMPLAYSLRGTVHYKKGDMDAAIADYSEAIRRDARNGEALNNRAWTYYRTGRAREGLPDADAAVRLLAREPYVWDTRAHIHAALGNREAAISDFRAALAIDPDYAESKAGLARLGVE